MAIIIDKRYLKIAQEHFTGEKIIPSFCSDKIQEPVGAHPDMSLTQIIDVFVCSPDSFQYYKGFLGNRVICGKTNLSSHYPYDIAYNVLIYKDFAFCKAENTDAVVKEELAKRNIKIININQGYAKCSAAVCNEGIITADESIYRTAESCGINVLKITPGHVRLLGYDYGFIGGASGVVNGRLTFFGDIRQHPDYLKICDFCEFDYIPDFPLTDIGTIFSI